VVYVGPPRLPPRDYVTFDDGLRRVHFRLWQILMAAITIVFTCWFVTFGLFWAIMALMVAKHVLVAILAVGLRLPTPPGAPSEACPPPT